MTMTTTTAASTMSNTNRTRAPRPIGSSAILKRRTAVLSRNAAAVAAAAMVAFVALSELGGNIPWTTTTILVADAFAASSSTSPGAASAASDAAATGADAKTDRRPPFFASHIKAKETATARRRKNDGQSYKDDGDGDGEGGSIILTYLEINGWLLTTTAGGGGTTTILIDPILEGSLDFGLPGGLYVGSKKTLPPRGLAKLLPSPVDCLLLTQGLDDHAHVRTLKTLFRLDPSLPVVAPPSARQALTEAGVIVRDGTGETGDDDGYGQRVRFLNHGEEVIIRPRAAAASKDDDDCRCWARIRATRGALVGPPWQRRENGYVISPANNNNSNNKSNSKNNNTNRRDRSFPSVYIEPHVEFDEGELARIARGPESSSGSSWSSTPDSGGGWRSAVDVVITPISGQTLPAFELVHGPKDAVRLLEILRPRYVVPMRNGNVAMSGPVAGLVSEVGSEDDFYRRLTASPVLGAGRTTTTTTIEVVSAPPGVDIEIVL